MTLLEGEILWNLVWVLPLILFLFFYSWSKRAAILKLIFGKRSDDPRYNSVSPSLRFWRGLIFAAVICLLVLAAARPSWGVSILPYTGHGRDLMVVFDTSKSMLSQDVRPSRLDHAKWLARQLAEKNPGDRFGLIAFAGHAFLECPLTIDKTSFLQSVDELATDSIPVGGTNLQKALSEAIRGFRAAETSFRAIVLITDGDELTGDSGKALDEIIRLKIPLFILGVGDPSQPAIIQVPDSNGGIRTLKDSKGNIVSAPLNEKQLSLLARRTGGIYVRSTTTHPGIDEIEARIKKLDVQELDSGKQTRPIERPVYPLLAAFILLCLWFALSEKRFGRKPSVKILLLVFTLFGGLGLSAQERALPSAAPSSAKKEPDGAKTAAKKVETLSPVELYNNGVKAQTSEKNGAKAAQLYEQAISASGAEAEVRSRSCQNLGVLNHQASRALFQKAQAALKGQQIDQALQQTNASIKQLAATEDIYKESMRDGQDVLSVSKNQQLLLRDRKIAEEFKKKLEELKKKQQQAQKNTQKALNQQQKQQQQKQQQKQQNKQDKQQQKQNQQKQQQKQQNKQDKQQQKQNQQDKQQQQQQKQQQQQQNKQDKQQQNKQDQQSQQQQQNQQQQLQDQTRKARESTRELEKQARDLNQKKLEDQAKKAGEELDKAKEAQNRKNDKEAEKHLKKALEQLGGKDQQKNDKDQKDKKDQKKNGKDQKDQKDQKKDGKDKELPKDKKPSDKGKNGKKEEEKDIDKDQAKSLLDLMANDEKRLKDELKERMKRNYGIQPVEKDW